MSPQVWPSHGTPTRRRLVKPSTPAPSGRLCQRSRGRERSEAPGRGDRRQRRAGRSGRRHRPRSATGLHRRPALDRPARSAAEPPQFSRAALPALASDLVWCLSLQYQFGIPPAWRDWPRSRSRANCHASLRSEPGGTNAMDDLSSILRRRSTDLPPLAGADQPEALSGRRHGPRRSRPGACGHAGRRRYAVRDAVGIRARRRRPATGHPDRATPLGAFRVLVRATWSPAWWSTSGCC